MTRDRQSAAAAERWPAERTIQTITPTSARTPRRIHSHSRLVPDPPLGVWELLGCAFTDGLATAEVTGTLGPGEVTAPTLGEGAAAPEVVAVGLGGGGLAMGEVAVGPGEVAPRLEGLALRLGDKLAT